MSYESSRYLLSQLNLSIHKGSEWRFYLYIHINDVNLMWINIIYTKSLWPKRTIECAFMYIFSLLSTRRPYASIFSDDSAEHMHHRKLTITFRPCACYIDVFVTLDINLNRSRVEAGVLGIVSWANNINVASIVCLCLTKVDATNLNRSWLMD